jgi:hypothetical protein
LIDRETVTFGGTLKARQAARIQPSRFFKSSGDSAFHLRQSAALKARL